MEIVENNMGSWEPGSAWRLSPAPQLRIGVADGDPNQQLFQVQDAHRFDEETIVVANAGTNQLRFFDSDGAFVRAVGGEGEGPGEFQSIDLVETVGDSIYVYDGQLGRLSVTSSGGVFSRSIPLAPLGDRLPLRPIGWFADGSFLAQASSAFWENPEPGLTRLQDTYVVVSNAGRVVETLGEYAGGETFILVEEKGVSSARLPFAHQAVVAVEARSYYYGSSDRYRIDRFSTKGRLMQSIRLARQPRTPGAADVEEVIAGMQTQIPEEYWAGIAARYRSMPLPKALPSYSAIALDAESNLWVQDYQPLPLTPSTWSVFDPDGRLLGAVTLPARFSPHQIGADFILGGWEDDLGVEYVDLYELVKEP